MRLHRFYIEEKIGNQNTIVLSHVNLINQLKNVFRLTLDSKVILFDNSGFDFIVTPNRGIYILEVNTLPGLTAQSLLPASLGAVGVSMPEFIDHVLRLATR